VYFNTATNGANYSGLRLIFNYTCTTPLPTDGIGNFTNAPIFADQAGGNLRLQSNSPCIDSGDNAYVVVSTDLDGRPRTVGGTVDIGAYEYQGPGLSLFIPWLQQFRLPTDGSADYTDSDGDGLNNWQEWRAGTDLTNAQSVLRLLAPTPLGPDLVVTWESVPGHSYFLEGSTNLGAMPRFVPLATHLTGSVSTTTFTHTNAAGPGPVFYRVGVE
jgi:hypothetical protein